MQGDPPLIGGALRKGRLYPVPSGPTGGRRDPGANVAIMRPVCVVAFASIMPMPRSALNLGAHASLALALCACQLEPAPPPIPVSAPTLVVAVRPGPTSWYPGPDGDPIGFDRDLVKRFAKERGLALTIIEVDSAAILAAKLASGDAHVAVGGLYPTESDTFPVLWTKGTFPVEPVLIYNRDRSKPASWRDLDGVEVAYPEATGIAEQLAHVRAAHGNVRWRAIPGSSERLIAQVSDGDLEFAVVPSSDATATRKVFVDVDVAFAAGPKQEQAWAVTPDRPDLRDDLDRFLTKVSHEGLLARLAERYFGQAGQVQRIDAGIFQERMQTVLPQFRGLFESAQIATGIEWRLLAAVAYQESRWDPAATSETGVRGFMQITEETAQHLRIADRLDPSASTAGAARYLAALKAKLPARIAEPDRTWFALAAFNIGLGHLEDARVLAQRQKLNPDSWADVRTALPLLALPEHYERSKNGYARGGMPVVFVDRVRAYYDILLRQAPTRVAALALAPTP